MLELSFWTGLSLYIYIYLSPLSLCLPRFLSLCFLFLPSLFISLTLFLFSPFFGPGFLFLQLASEGRGFYSDAEQTTDI